MVAKLWSTMAKLWLDDGTDHVMTQSWSMIRCRWNDMLVHDSGMLADNTG